MKAVSFKRVEIVIAEDPRANGLTNPVGLSISVEHPDGSKRRHASMHPTMRLALMHAGQQAFNLHTIGELDVQAGEVRRRQK